VSVYSAGAASVRRSVAGGAIFDDAPATSKWRGQMEGAAANVRAKYAGDGPYQVEAVLADVDKWWRVASQFAEQAATNPTSTMRPDQVKRAKDNALNLLEARAALKLRIPTAYSVTGPEARQLTAFMVAPIEWLISVGEPALSSAEAPASWIKRGLWIVGGLAGIWAVSKLLDSGVSAKREIFGARPLFAPKALVKNPPAWAADPEIWESARVAVEPYRDSYDNPEVVTVHVYKQMGGRVS
jgi:hypothetical protein